MEEYIVALRSWDYINFGERKFFNTVSVLCSYRVAYVKCPLLYHCYTGHAVAQLVEALRYKLEGRGFDFRWGHWDLSLT
jgi:hypothetical protein